MAPEKQVYTKFERARIIGARALQISANAPILIKLDKEELEKLNYDPIKISEIEFESGILPITVHRPLPKRIDKKEPEIVEIVEEETEDKEVKKEEKKAIKEEVAEEVKPQEQEEEEEEPAEPEKEEVVEEEDAGESF